MKNSKLHGLYASIPQDFLKSKVNVQEFLEFIDFYLWTGFTIYCGITINENMFDKKHKWYWKTHCKPAYENYRKEK